MHRRRPTGTITPAGVGSITDDAGTPGLAAMKMPHPSWRPTTGQLTTTAIAVVFLLIGFWIGWQHRSTTSPQTITPTVPRNMRTKAAVIVPATGSTATAPTQSTAAATDTAPAVIVPPRGKVTVAVLNAGGTQGAAVQVAVTLVQLGYPTPYTGNVSLPPDLVPTLAAPAAPAPTTTAARSSSVPARAATGTVTTTRTATTRGLPELVYYRPGGQAIADRLAGDLRIADTAPMPSTGVIQAAAPSAQLVVVIGAQG